MQCPKKNKCLRKNKNRGKRYSITILENIYKEQQEFEEKGEICMENLMDLYRNIQNPLVDLDKLKKIIKIYSESNKDGKDFYKNLVHI